MICGKIIPAALILVFAYTGTAKLIDHTHFFHQLINIRFMGSFAFFVSYFIPLAELAVASLLLFEGLRIPGLLLSTLLMVSFIVYVGIVLTGDRVPCSCGGIISTLSWRAHLYFNIGLLVFSLASLFYYKSLHVYKEVS